MALHGNHTRREDADGVALSNIATELPKWVKNFLERKKLPLDWIWRYVEVGEKDECWPWLGTRRKGYGRYRTGGPNFQSAHRVVFVLCKFGGDFRKFARTGLLVRHTCDNPSCCNPRHLLSGTHLDNARDRLERDRCNPIRGETVHSAKLNTRDVRKIRKRLLCGEKPIDLANEYGVTRQNINAISKKETWKHVP